MEPSSPPVTVVVPSMTFDAEELAKIEGAVHFEERMLWLLQSLRDPDARVVYVTSEPLPDSLVAYSTSLTGRNDARSRLALISCGDSTPVALTDKILARSDIQERIRVAAGSGATMMCHVATESEGRLAEALGAKLFACPPDLVTLGTKSGSRRSFAAAGVPMPDGVEDVTDRRGVIEALGHLKARNPELTRAVIKLNDSFAGGGNCVVRYPPGEPTPEKLDLAVASAAFVDARETVDRYFDAFTRMGGIVEAWVEGSELSSPSAQLIISTSGTVRVQSTHEQILGGTDNQTYYGCTFPAHHGYSVAIAESARGIGEVLAAAGVRGHLSIDFVCHRLGGRWHHVAIEVNLRMGGATAPISFLESATGRTYEPETGTFAGPQMRPLFYKSADRIQSDSYRTLNPERILDGLGDRSLLYDPERGSGAIMYMLGAAATVGKVGVVAVDDAADAANTRFDAVITALDEMAREAD